MSKYIDADLLRKELERRITDNTFGAKLELIDILAWLNSIQQEQPELPKIAEYYYHKGKYEGLSQGRADALKILEESMKRKADPVIVIKRQEQQEVDLEKEIEDYWIATGWSKVITLGKFKVIARYFYGLGQLNNK